MDCSLGFSPYNKCEIDPGFVYVSSPSNALSTQINPICFRFAIQSSFSISNISFGFHFFILYIISI